MLAGTAPEKANAKEPGGSGAVRRGQPDTPKGQAHAADQRGSTMELSHFLEKNLAALRRTDPAVAAWVEAGNPRGLESEMD